ncbi:MULTISPECIES: ABC transporter permease [unclassified Chelatococcus]|uniref:ABC transporter permease n=1 Tax=unclassified Chelatococcus TaxID=2638111 RepID=UPI001BCF00D4|nr:MULTISPECIES: ABC transporter permease [unclassified Chelatococcus]MBS7700244.1 ABC transporter permease [Chelatococcus sp. YT9]MBX3558215.1 ABC transporter permease [Chelatococcus sp.]
MSLDSKAARTTSKPRKAPVRISPARRKLENLALQILLIGAFLLLWEYASDRWIPKLMVSKPTDIWATIWKWLWDGTFAENLWVTIKATAAAFILGAVGGMALGFATGAWKRLGEVLQPIVTAFYTLPRLALAPLFLLWFGLGMEFRIMFAATIVFFLVYYNTYFGVREVSAELISAVRIMGANQFQVALRVIIPSALVWVAAGLKISVPYALVGVVVAEMLASDQGMGYLLSRGASQFSASQSFAAIFGLLVVALVIDWIITKVTDRALRWKTAGTPQ